MRQEEYEYHLALRWHQLKWAGWDIAKWIRAGWCPQHGIRFSRKCPVCTEMKDRTETEQRMNVK